MYIILWRTIIVINEHMHHSLSQTVDNYINKRENFSRLATVVLKSDQFLQRTANLCCYIQGEYLFT